MAEHAIAIARVSLRKQRPEDQRPELVAYAERKGYVLDDVVPVHGRSAFHGKHVKAIRTAVEKHVRHGGATVVIFREVDRSSRQGVFEGYRLLLSIMDAGARVEFSEQEHLNSKPELLGLYFEMAQAESEVKRTRKLQGNRVKKEAGELVGRVPWGYDAVRRNGIQVGIVPNNLGRQWIPAIFNECVAGKSLRSLADMLSGIPAPQGGTAWNTATVKRLIASTTYYGEMSSNPNLNFEALVSVELWKEANFAVVNRRRRGRGTVKWEPALAKPYCGACYGVERPGAPSGKSPMYRTVRIQGERLYEYYTCSGHGPARKSCGARSVPVKTLDKAIDAFMASATRPHRVPAFEAGDDNDEKRALVNEKIRVAQEAGNYARVAELAQEAMAIGPSVRKASMALVPSGLTVGQHWKTLSFAEKREELAKWTIIVKPDGMMDFQGPWESVPDDYDQESKPDW